MKKLKLLVMTLGIVACTSIPAYAKLPYNNGEQGMLIIGNTAYSISYLANLSSEELKGINDLIIKKNGQAYYCLENNGNEFICNTSLWKNYNPAALPLSSPTPESGVNSGQPITYYDTNTLNGQVYVYQSGEYQPQSISATATARTDYFGNIKMLYVTIQAAEIKGVSGAAYFKLDDSPTISTLGSTIKCLLKDGEDYENVSILDVNKKVIAQGKIDVRINSVQDFELTPPPNDISGLGTGNINNNGYAAKVGNWIYYSNTADSGKLYKVTADGMDNQQVSNDKAGYINVVGDTIYYTNYSDSGKIYKINSDGTGRTMICSDMASYLTVSGSTLYYSNHSKGGALYKIDTTGGLGTKLSDDNAAYITVDGNTVYYSNYSDGRKIYSVNTNGLCRTQISEQGAMFIQNYSNYLYFSNYSDGGRIYKIEKNNPSVAVKVSDNRTSAMNIAYDCIYYSNYSDGNKLYRMNVDGSSSTGPITKDSVEFVNVLNDNKIYYTKAGKLSVATPVNNKWTVTAVTKPALTDKITKMDNLSDTAPTDEIALAYPLPDRVPAIMSNNVIKELVVNWDKTKQPVKKGNAYTYSGIVLGYGNKVTFTVTVTASGAIDPENNIKVLNNGGPNDVIEFTGLKPLDTVYVYATSTASACQVSGQVPSGSTTLTLNTTLDNSGSIWVTVKNAKGTQTTEPSESKRVQKTYPAETAIKTGVTVNVTNEAGAKDKVEITGVTAGDIIKLYKNQNDSDPIKNGTKTAGSEYVMIDGLDLGPSEGSTGKLWYGITKGSLIESQRNSVPIPESKNVALVKAAREILTDDFFKNAIASALDSDGKIKNNITLPTTCTVTVSGIGVDVPIKWTVENKDGLAPFNKPVVRIIRPLYNSHKDLNVAFHATPYSDDYPLDETAGTITFTKVIAETTPLEIVNHDAPIAAERLSYASGDSQDSVTGNVNVQTIGDWHSTITWRLKDPSDYVTNISGGVVTIKRPSHGAGDKTITLIPKASFGGETNEYTTGTAITIKQLSGTTEDINTAFNKIPNTAEIKDIQSNPYSNYLLSDITGSLSTDIQTSWVSDDPSKILIDTDNQNVQKGTAHVNAPSYSDGDANVMLHLTITEGSETRQKDITATVLHLPPTAQESVKATGDQLSYYLLVDKNEEPNKDSYGNVLLTKSSGTLYLPLNSYTGDGKFQVPDLSGTDKEATITWQSSDNDIINGTTGVIGAKTGTVTMTATIKRGSSTNTRIFTFIVQ